MKLRIRFILIVAFVGLSVIPFTIGIVNINLYTAEQFRLQIEEKLSAISNIAKKRILESADRTIENTQKVAEHTFFPESLNDWVLNASPDALAKIDEILQEEAGEISSLVYLVVYDRYGRGVSSYGVELPHKFDKTDKIPLGGPSVQLLNKGDQLFVQSIAQVKLGEEEAVGFLKAVFEANFIVDILEDRTGLGETGEWGVFARNENGDAQYAIAMDGTYDEEYNRIIPKKRTDIPMTQALLGNEGIFRDLVDYRDVPVLASTRYLPEQDWGLVVKIDLEEVEMLVRDANRSLIYIELLIVILAVFLGILVSLSIARPLERVRAQVDRIASGDFQPEHPTGGWYETREVTRDINRMAQALKELNENLNDKVKRRTKRLHRINRKLKKMAVVDPLTGLFNRRYFFQRLDHELSRSKRYGSHLALVIFDIDFFKKINDSYGHAGGDAVLKRLSRYLKDTLRKTDIVARVGGEEFCIAMPSDSADNVMSTVERIRREIEQLVVRYEDKIIPVRASFGVAHFMRDKEDAEGLMKKADDALYRSKENGRNRVTLWNDWG